MENIDRVLSNIYYNPQNSVAFSGFSRLYKFVKNNNINITKSQIKKWLRQQETYSLHKPAKRPQTTSIQVSFPDEQWSADLMDMSEFSQENDGIKFVLLVVDTFTKFMWAVALKNKSSKSVSEAFQQIFSLGRKPKRIRSDKGQEFRGKATQSVMDKNNIVQLFAQNEQKASISERAIKTIKSKIYRYFTHKNSFRYVDVLQDLVNGYNMSTHRSTGFKPKDISEKNAEDVRISSFLKTKRLPKTFRYRFKVGDKVRITYLKRKFNREYDHKWTGEVFTVTNRFKRQGVPIYQVSDYNNESITGSFYSNELELAENDPDKLFKIEKVLKERGRGRNKEYYVQWLYWPKKFRSWVKASDVTVL